MRFKVISLKKLVVFVKNSMQRTIKNISSEYNGINKLLYYLVAFCTNETKSEYLRFSILARNSDSKFKVQKVFKRNKRREFFFSLKIGLQ